MTTLSFVPDESDGQFRVHIHATPSTDSATINFQFTYTATTLVFDRLSVNGSSALSSSASHAGTQGQVSINGSISPSVASGDILATLEFSGEGSGTFDLDISSILISGSTPTYTDPSQLNYSVESLPDTQTITLNEDTEHEDYFSPFDSFFSTTLSVDTSPSHGTIEIISPIVGNDSWKYTPDENYWGEDQFTIKAQNVGDIDTLVVDANIQPVNDFPIGTVVVAGTGTPVEGELLSADTSEIQDVDGLGEFSFQWLRNNQAIEGENDDSYSLTEADIGTGISVAISYTDGGGTSESMTSSVYDVAATSTVSIVDDDGNLWDSMIDLGDETYIEATEAQLYRSYYGALGRLPDEEGFNWWLNEIREGRHDLNSMASGFIDSDEFVSLADADQDSSISNEELINHIYSGVFGREPDQSGFDYWVGILDSGEKTQAGAFIDMTQSNEYVELTLVTVSNYEFLA